MSDQHDEGDKGDGAGDGTDGGVVVVPHATGPIVRLHRPTRSSRSRDELDDLIDDLFPDTDEGPGWFDAGLVVVAAGLVGWGLAGGPTATLVVGGVGLFLGAILPVRWAWRRLDRRRQLRRRRSLLAQGVSLDLGHPATARLARSYEALGETCFESGPWADGDTRIAAAHGAMLEVATLLAGRRPVSPAEIAYVEARAAAIDRLTQAVSAARPPQEGREPKATGPAPALLIEARAELDSLTGTNALTRLDDLTTEARRGHADA